MATTWRPKFKIGDYVCFASHVSVKPINAAGLDKYENLVVTDRSVRLRSRDPRANRYEVAPATHVGSKVRGWFYEDDLEAC